MIFSRASTNWWLLAGGIMLLLWLGALQYRWIERASEAEQQERRQFLRTALGGVRNELMERLRKPLTTMRSDPAVTPGSDYVAHFASLFEQWRQSGVDPELVAALTIGWSDRSGNIKCRGIDAVNKASSDCEWPSDLRTYRAVLEQQLRMPRGVPFPFPGVSSWDWNGSRLALIFPIVEAVQPSSPRPDNGMRGLLMAPPGFGNALPPPRRPDPTELRGWCVLDIDHETVRKLLSEIVLRYFGEAGINNYQVALVSDEPHQVVYRSSSGDLGWQPGDAADEELPFFFAPPRPERDLRPPGGIQYDKREPPPPGGDSPGRSFVELPRWRLVARHNTGSLAAAIRRNRRQSLALSAGVLLLLLGSGVLLVLSTHRARRLARRQMEFVAGVSHELRTPLTVIQTTSYNLAQGKVIDSRRVQQYGEAIQKEVRRLTTQVEQILSFAGIESGRKLYDLQPAKVADAVARAFAEYRPAFESAGWQVEQQIESDIPAALADAQVLEGALKNLLQNALKYAAGGHWLGITARAACPRGCPEIQITIADRGPGIDPEDLPHIYEPFYRGRNETAGSSSPGVGLGLCLVERHLRAMGGRVTVKTAVGQGSAFTLHLPSTTSD